MQQLFSFLSRAAIVLFLVLVQVLEAQALSFNGSVPALLVFGDSLVDPGNNNVLPTIARSNFPPYGRDFVGHKATGRFSNGKIATDLIASELGLKEFLPPYLDPNLQPEDLLTGVSFGSAGTGFDIITAKTFNWIIQKCSAKMHLSHLGRDASHKAHMIHLMMDPLLSYKSVLSLGDQLDMFKEYMEKLKGIAGEERAAHIISESLYIVCFGNNDVVNTYFASPSSKLGYDFSSYADFLVQTASNFVQDLFTLGARKIGVVGLPPLGCLPSQRTIAGGKKRVCVDYINEAAKEYNSKLSTELEMLGPKLSGTKIVYIDFYSPAMDIFQQPTKYGFEQANRGCCGTGIFEYAVLCNELSPHTCTDVSKYVFFDSFHPTQRTYELFLPATMREYLPRLI